MENKSFYLMVKGQKVEVSEEVYRAYVRPIRNEQRQMRRNCKCKIMGPKGNLIRCDKNCNKCEYAENGKAVSNTILSLDKFKEDGVEIENSDFDIEAMYIEKEEKELLQKKVRQAIATLLPRQQEIVRMIYFEGKSQVEVAKHYGVGKTAIANALTRIHAALRKKIEEN